MTEKPDRDHLETAFLYALQALSAGETSDYEAHLSLCAECRREIETLRPVLDSFVTSFTGVLRPSASLWERLARRISGESGVEPVLSPARLPAKAVWEELADGVFCKLLSIDAGRDLVTMLVRLAPGAHYPAHRHGEHEEVYLLSGELCIDDKKFKAGDFLRSEPGSVDHRVWSDVGCSCVLLTSLRDTIL